MNTHSLVEISLSGLDDAVTPSVISLFDRWGRGGAVVEQSADEPGRCTVKTYLLPEDDGSLRQIEIGLEILNQAWPASSLDDVPATHRLPEPRIRFLSEADWAEAWKAGYDVFRVGQHLVIKPTWREYAPQAGDMVIELDPGMAFGSGLHPTTRLCLEALEDYLHPGARLLDVGTGSGILAIAAARLGASRVLALDTDPLAVRVARENLALNQVESVVRVERGTVQITNGKSGNQGSGGSGNQESGGAGEQGSRGARERGSRGAGGLEDAGWDVVAANILAETIVELMSGLAASLSAGGILIASGIIQDRAEAVVTALRQNGLSLLERRDEGEWLALIAACSSDNF